MAIDLVNGDTPFPGDRPVKPDTPLSTEPPISDLLLRIDSDDVTVGDALLRTGWLAILSTSSKSSMLDLLLDMKAVSLKTFLL